MTKVESIDYSFMGTAASLISGVNIRVSPDALVTQADEVSRLARNMKERFDAIGDLIDKTAGYWIGEAGDLHRSMYNEQRDNITLMLGRLSEHPENLVAIARNYESGESRNVQAASVLPSDVLL